MEAYVKSLVPLLEQKVRLIASHGLICSIREVIYRKRSRSERFLLEISWLPEDWVGIYMNV
jgi:hypothetical protein